MGLEPSVRRQWLQNPELVFNNGSAEVLFNETDIGAGKLVRALNYMEIYQCPSDGKIPRIRVISHNNSIKLPATLTPICLQCGRTICPIPPINSMAGKVPSPNAIIVIIPDKLFALTAACATKA